MKTATIDLPAMYADHHVTEVRKLLLELPGVKEVYASSAFQVVEVSFDGRKTSEEQIRSVLDEAGYLGELPVAEEMLDGQNGDRELFLRQAAVYEQTKQTVGFAQKVPYQGRPLWPCPGLGPIDLKDDGR